MKKILSLSSFGFLIVSSLFFLQGCGNSPKESSSKTKAVDPTLVIDLVKMANEEITKIQESFNKLADMKAKAAQDSQDAKAFISVLAETLYHDLNIEASKKKIRPFNVAMCDNANRCDLAANEGMHYLRRTVTFRDRSYTLFGFRGGVLTNNGNNGWDQWTVLGCHDLVGGQGIKVVHFKNTGWIGPIAAANPGCLR